MTLKTVYYSRHHQDGVIQGVHGIRSGMRSVKLSDPEIVFCLLTFKKTPWLIRSILSITKYCPTRHKILILSQGPPDRQLNEFLTRIHDDRVELLISPVNVGCGPGRRLLADRVSSPLTMMFDDDMYLTEGAIAHAVQVFEKDSRIGAVSMPQYDLQGHMLSLGGHKLGIQNGVITRRIPKVDFRADWIEVEDLTGGAMLYRTEMNEDFSWDDRFVGAFDDLDKSMQIIQTGRWKQAVVPRGRLIHDRSWVENNPNYGRTRFNGLMMRRSYRLFRKKWGLRLDLRGHFLYEVAYPALTLMRCSQVASYLDTIKLRRRRYSQYRRDIELSLSLDRDLREYRMSADNHHLFTDFPG